jgi:hypothetical protein
MFVIVSATFHPVVMITEHAPVHQDAYLNILVIKLVNLNVKMKTALMIQETVTVILVVITQCNLTLNVTLPAILALVIMIMNHVIALQGVNLQ